MKKLSYLILAFCISLTLTTACDNSPEGPELSQNPTPPVISSPSSGESYVLQESDEDNDLLTVEWTSADYGFSAPVAYRVEISPAGSNFETMSNFGTVRGETQFTPTVGSMNAALLSAGAVANSENDMEVRVRSALTGTDHLYSESVTLTFIPYATDVQISEIYLPGSYQSASGYTNDWSPEDAPALTSASDDGNYEGYVYFHNDNNEFKITPERNWNADWGIGDSEGTLDPDGGNIPMDEAGYYKFNVDIENLTYETLRTEWGIIGEAVGGWDEGDDVMMNYDIDNRVWTVTTDMNAGLFKFRANEDWALNYGDNDADGTLQEGGADITLEESGNYTVVLDLSGFPYTYSVSMN